jgi:hypothetical protein
MSAAALDTHSCFGAIDEDMSHRNRGEREEVRSIVPVGARLIDELEIGLVHERGRGKRLHIATRGPVAMGDVAQLVVENGDETVE